MAPKYNLRNITYAFIIILWPSDVSSSTSNSSLDHKPRILVIYRFPWVITATR
jgi:hypothetical protein